MQHGSEIKRMFYKIFGTNWPDRTMWVHHEEIFTVFRAEEAYSDQ